MGSTCKAAQRGVEDVPLQSCGADIRFRLRAREDESRRHCVLKMRVDFVDSGSEKEGMMSGAWMS